MTQWFMGEVESSLRMKMYTTKMQKMEYRIRAGTRPIPMVAVVDWFDFSVGLSDEFLQHLLQGFEKILDPALLFSNTAMQFAILKSGPHVLDTTEHFKINVSSCSNFQNTTTMTK